MIIGQEMAEIRHGGGGGHMVPFLEFVRCGRFFGDCAPAKKVAILTSCNIVILNGQNLGAAGVGRGRGVVRWRRGRGAEDTRDTPA